MNGHEKRAQKKKIHIKKTALHLFNKHGVNKISVDDIADNASVSKTTIYKYFSSKNGLYREIVKMIFEESINKIKSLLESNLTFPEKLKRLIDVKTTSGQYMKGQFIEEIIKNDFKIGEEIEDKYMNRIRLLMFKFFDEGKNKGYIDRNISNNIIYLYIDIFKSGLKEKSSELHSLINYNDDFGSIVNLFFYGIIHK